MLPWFQRHSEKLPFIFGLGEGLAYLFAILFLFGLLQGTATVPALTLAVFAIVAYKRPLSWQLTVAVVLALSTDVLSAKPLAYSIGTLGAGLLATQGLVDSEGSRWDAGHLVFSVVAVLGGFGFDLIRGLVLPGFSTPAFLSIIGTLGLTVLAVGVGAGLRFAATLAHPQTPSLARRMG